MTMKTGHRVKHKKQPWSETSRGNYRKVKWIEAGEGAGEEPSEMNVKCTSRPRTSNPSVANLRSEAVSSFRPVGKRTNTAGLITRSSPLVVAALQKYTPRRNSTDDLTGTMLLPPIKGSRTSPGRSVWMKMCASPSPRLGREEPGEKERLEARRSKAKPDRGNLSGRLQADRRNETLTRSLHVYDHSSLAAQKVAKCLQYEKPLSAALTSTECVSKKSSVHLQSAKPRSASLDPSAKKQKPDQGCAHNAPDSPGKTTELPGAGANAPQSPGAFSTGSAAESGHQRARPAEDVDGDGETHPPPEEDYYTSQRIAEWVLKVNASLFSPASDTHSTSGGPGTEQDTAIKIVYDGD